MYFKQIFKKFDLDSNGTIEFEEFVKMMDFMRLRTELQPIFDAFKNQASNLIDAEGLKRFMSLVQGESNITLEQCQDIINKIVPLDSRTKEHDFKIPGLDLRDFGDLMFSTKLNRAIDPNKLVVN